MLYTTINWCDVGDNASVMSRKFELQVVGKSVLSADFYPPIELDRNARYGLGLLGFYGCNTIHNITDRNNTVGFEIPAYDSYDVPRYFTMKIPSGAYEIEEINDYLQKKLASRLFPNEILDSMSMDEMFSLQANNNIFKCILQSKYNVDFRYENSIGPMLGFKKQMLNSNKPHQSTFPVNIVPVRLIRLECNIISGSYINNEENHILFSFDLDVERGYNLTKEPRNIIYMPISPEGRQFIDNITVRILDQKNNLIDFGSEESIVVILELKKL